MRCSRQQVQGEGKMKASFLVVAAITTSALAQSSNVSYVRTMTDGLTYPARIAGGAGGEVFVTDPPGKAIVKYDSAGTLLATYTIPETPKIGRAHV